MLRVYYFTSRLINLLVMNMPAAHASPSAADRLSATFAALADPTRRAILARLASGEASVNELAEPFSISPPAVTKHLKMLERAGLISRTREAQRRPCKLEAQPLQEAMGWIEQYRQMWEARLDRLDDYLKQLQATADTAALQTTPAPAIQEKKRGRKKQ